MIEHSEKTDQEADAELVEALRILGRKRSISPNDFDVAGSVEDKLTDDARNRLNSIKDRNEVLYEISWLGERFNPDSQDGFNARKKIRAVVTYAHAEEGCEYYPFIEYLRDTLAIEDEAAQYLNLIPDEALESQLKVVTEKYSSLGYEFDRPGWEKFKKENKIPKEKLLKEFDVAREELMPKMRDALGVDFMPNYRIVTDRVDEYWKNWVKGNTQGFTQRINLHPRHDDAWLEGVPWRLTGHEGEHMFLHHSWMLNIASEKIPHFYGITTTPGIEQWGSEGFADAATRFLPSLYESLPLSAQASVEHELYRNWVYGNAHVLLNITEDGDRIREWVLARLPSETEEGLEKQIRDRTQSHRDRSYLFSYKGSFYLSQYAKILTSEDPIFDKRKEFVDFLLFRPRTPMEILNHFRRLEDSIPLKRKSFLNRFLQGM